MDTIRIEDLSQLANRQDATAISIYLPTHLAPDARQDSIRLKNLLDRAQDELQARGMRRSEAEQLLAAARGLPDNAEFWKGLCQGLAIFVTPQVFYAYRLPLSFTESLTIHRRLMIKPLLPAADRGERFLLLALSQNQVRLFESRHDQIRAIKVPSLPKNKSDALNYDGADRGEQVHAAMNISLGKQAGVFHGQGVIKDTAKADITQFFRAVQRTLDPVLRGESAPLLLAGVDYLLPLFRQACSYPHLLERHLSGNCDFLTEHQLHERGWEVMRPFFDRPRREAMEKLHALLGTGKASADVAEIAAAAVAGKIETLFIDDRQTQLGTVDAKSGKAVLCDFAFSNSEDLVNLAACESLNRGATVYAARPGELPALSPVGAIFRY